MQPVFYFKKTDTKQQKQYLKCHKTNVMLMRLIVLIACAGALLHACNGKPAQTGLVDAYVPVYSSRADAEKILLQAPQVIANGGKIATLGTTLYQVDEGKGIHIIDFSNAAAPVKKAFIQVPLCHELTVKGSYIYTNNLADLVVLDLSTANTVKVTSRVSNAFPDLAIQYPPVAGAWFECADAAKGVVTAWELKKLTNPKCKRP